MNKMKQQSLLTNGLLIVTTIIWGTTFIGTKTLVQVVPVFVYLFIRHVIALIGYIPFFSQLRTLNRKIWGIGLITGGANFLMIVFQSYGLTGTTAGKAGFITGLNVLMVPFLVWILFKEHLEWRIWIPVTISIVGMLIMFYEGFGNALQFNWPEGFVLIAAFWNAIQIVYTGKYAPHINIYMLSIVQLIWISFFLFLGSLISGGWNRPIPITPFFWGVEFYLGLIATTLPFLFVNYGQKYTTSTNAAIIFSLEPIFAAFFGYLLGNEQISIQIIIGGLLIIGAMIISIIFTRKNDKKKFVD
jgi:drug/metabolite transporter (DMT)-like permease